LVRYKSFTNVNRKVPASSTANKSHSSHERQHTELKLSVVTLYGFFLVSYPEQYPTCRKSALKFHCVDFKPARADRCQSLWRIRDIKYTHRGIFVAIGLHMLRERERERESALIFLIKLCGSKNFSVNRSRGASQNIHRRV